MSTDDDRARDRLADPGALDEREQAWLARIGQHNALGWSIAGRNPDGHLVMTCTVQAGRANPATLRHCSATLTPAGLVHATADLAPNNTSEIPASTGDDRDRPRSRARPGAYAGIGSRHTPTDVLALMAAVAQRLAADGWTLRTGGAPGADQAFHTGATSGQGAIELYLPWPTFQAQALPALGEVTLRLDRPAPAAYQIAARHHPNWSMLNAAARHLHARNTHQILGPNLEPADPVRFVICWTPNASTNGLGRHTGGTGQALRIAAAHGVDVFNLARPDHERRVRSLLKHPRTQQA
jgi:hypothetical protein